MRLFSSNNASKQMQACGGGSHPSGDQSTPVGTQGTHCGASG